MKTHKRKRLESAGWRVGSTTEFLDLSSAEELLVEIHLSLSETLRQRRIRARITQTELARLLRSSQSRIAKMESGDQSVSLELLIRALLAIGATRSDLALAIRKRVA
jgi:predicted transcriptional regulator